LFAFVLYWREVWHLMLRKEGRQRTSELRVLMGLVEWTAFMKREAANGCVIKSFVICVLIQMLQKCSNQRG